ncbi:unnamed protein product [Rodentolepis nana]|uniref:CSN12-like protein n=1 Tax=Rodentolepis nana TaxID=102285 RepID=A0A0R3T1B6_RODNA|nr:unnamed protein product [Rodentolepis nana]
MPCHNNSAWFLIFCAFGVFCSYSLYAILQETITKAKYGPNNESFNFILSTLFIQCLVNAIIAKIALQVKPEPEVTKIATKDYALCALSYIGAMFSSNTSLHYVDYPTQVVGKSIKPIPVMLLSIIWARKRYPLRRYLFVGMITAGVILFMYKGNHSKSGASVDLGWGHILLLISLTLDGFTGGMQEDFRSRTHIGPYSLMMRLNLWSLLYLWLAVIAKNELFAFLLFVKTYPFVLVYILLFGIVSAVGQMFIYTTIINFGSLMCSIVTTTRKFFTVLASIALFGHAISTQQVLGAALVFSGLLADQIMGKDRHKTHKEVEHSRKVVGLSEDARLKKECLWAIGENDYDEACRCQIVLTGYPLYFIFSQEENWLLPVVIAVVVDLRKFAHRLDVTSGIRVAEGDDTSYSSYLERVAQSIMRLFQTCAADGRTRIEDSKKCGMMGLANQLFKIYFHINKLNLCKPIIRAIENMNIDNYFTLAQRVTYNYYVGRKAMFDGDLKLANKCLTYTFERCLASNRANKRLALIYLIPVRMLLGIIPKGSLLHKYDLMEFEGIAIAVKNGNLQKLHDELEKNEAFFISCGIYLILEKLKMITYRNLFKRIAQILNTHLLPIGAFMKALKTMGVEDIDEDETECILANLIYEGKIKGYLAHQQQKLVVSKLQAFPPL